MKKKLVFVAGLAFLFLTACSSISVNYDYDTESNFSQFKTYKWLRNKKLKTDNKLNSIGYKRIRKAVNSELKLKGFEIKNKGNADFFVIAYADVRDKINITDFGYGYGSYWGGRGGNIFVNRYKQGTLVIDIVDSKTKQLVWRGIGSKAVGRDYSPKEKTQMVREVVNKILENFPPKN